MSTRNAARAEEASRARPLMLDSIQIGPRISRSRVVSLPHGQNALDPERLERYLAELAENLIGMVVLGGSVVSPRSWRPTLVKLFDDATIDRLEGVTEGVRSGVPWQLRSSCISAPKQRRHHSSTPLRLQVFPIPWTASMAAPRASRTSQLRATNSSRLPRTPRGQGSTASSCMRRTITYCISSSRPRSTSARTITGARKHNVEPSLASSSTRYGSVILTWSSDCGFPSRQRQTDLLKT